MSSYFFNCIGLHMLPFETITRNRTCNCFQWLAFVSVRIPMRKNVCTTVQISSSLHYEYLAIVITPDSFAITRSFPLIRPPDLPA